MQINWAGFGKNYENFKEPYKAKVSVLLWMESIMGICKRNLKEYGRSMRLSSGRRLPREDWQDRRSRGSDNDIHMRIKHL